MKRLIQIVMVLSILGGGYLGYYMWRESPRTSEDFFESGKKYYRDKKYEEAVIQFLNALKKDPRHREARHLLALSHLSQQDWLRAV